MQREMSYRDVMPDIIYRYSWKFLELVSVFVFAAIFGTEKFALAFITILIVLFVSSLFKVRYPNQDAEPTKEFYNNYYVFSILSGVVLAGIFFLLSLIAQAPYQDVLKFVFVILFLKSFTFAPESFFMSRNRKEIVYWVNTVSQLIFLSFVVFFAYRGLGYESMLYGYIIYTLFRIVVLWKKFPYKISPTFNIEVFSSIISMMGMKIKHVLFDSLSYYGLLGLVFFAFGPEGFSVVYIAMALGYFTYRNATLFLTDLLEVQFKEFLNNNLELFKFNLVRISEYISFISVPIITISIVLSKELVLYTSGAGFAVHTDILVLLLLSGLAKTLSEVMRLVFISKGKEKIMQRIKLLELASLVIGIILFRPLDIYGIAIAILISSIISSSLYVIISGRITKMSMVMVSRDYFYILFSGLLTGLSIGLIKEVVPINSILSLFIFIAAAKTIYFALTFFFNKDLYRRFIRFLYTWKE